MLGDEVDDSAQLLAGLYDGATNSQSTPHNLPIHQGEAMPTPKQKRSNGKKKSRIGDANPDTLSDFKTVEALSELPLPEAGKKTKKRKAAEIDVEVPNASELSTPKEKSKRKKSKKSKSNSSASEELSQHRQPDGTNHDSHGRTAKKQKLDSTLELAGAAEDSPHGDIRRLRNATESAIGTKPREEKRKDKEGKRSKKAAESVGLTTVEAPASNEHGKESSMMEFKTGKAEDQQGKDDRREARRLAKAERRRKSRKKREEEIMESEERYPGTETGKEGFVGDPGPSAKPKTTTRGHLPNDTTTSKNAESDRGVDAIAKPTEVPYTGGVEALRATTPELDSPDQPNTGPEVRSAYFTPEKQKLRKVRSSSKVKQELLEQGVGSPKTDLERKKEAREKQAGFRAEIVAANRRPSIDQTGAISLHIKNLDVSRNLMAETSEEPNQPAPQIAEATKTARKNDVEFTASAQAKPRKQRQSKNMIDVISNEAHNTKDTSVALQEVIAMSDPGPSATNRVERISKPQCSQVTDPASIQNTLTDKRAAQNYAQGNGNSHAGAAIEPVIPESLQKHNGWIPINHDSLTATRQPGFRENCTVFGSIRKPGSNEGFIGFDSASENITHVINTPVSSTGERVLRNRKSCVNADGGADESMVVKSTRKPRKVKQEPLDFQSPMIQ